jgi:hypothetical protein
MAEAEPKKLADDTIATLRTLAHDLSNAIENIMQASYLISQTRNEHNSKWIELINSAANDASRINREIREILKSQS